MLDVSICLYAREEKEFFMSCTAAFTLRKSVKTGEVSFMHLVSGGNDKMSGFNAQI